jgi:hypothetical protein
MIMKSKINNIFFIFLSILIIHEIIITIKQLLCRELTGLTTAVVIIEIIMDESEISEIDSQEDYYSFGGSSPIPYHFSHSISPRKVARKKIVDCTSENLGEYLRKVHGFTDEETIQLLCEQKFSGPTFLKLNATMMDRLKIAFGIQLEIEDIIKKGQSLFLFSFFSFVLFQFFILFFLHHFLLLHF